MMTDDEIDCNKEQKSRVREEIAKFLAERDDFVPLEEIAEHLEMPPAEVKERMADMCLFVHHPFFPVLNRSGIGKLVEKDGRFKLATMKEIEDETERLTGICLKIKEFFDANPENYYTAEEICKATGLCKEDVRGGLIRVIFMRDYYFVKLETIDGADYYKKSAEVF